MIAISACLLGFPCRYNATHALSLLHADLLKDLTILPFCPEILGRLSVPREPSEIIGGSGADVWTKKAFVISSSGRNVTDHFLIGALNTKKLLDLNQVELVIVKDKSPSCGKTLIYDGSFKGKLIKGDGVTTAYLRQTGFNVYHEGEMAALTDWKKERGW